jgi:signal transduction histidine kinase
MADGWHALRRARGSIRVRIALGATVVVACTIAIAAWGLVRSVEHQLVDKVRDSTSARVTAVATQLQAGVSPTAIAIPAAGGGVQVLAQDGRPVAGGPLPIGTSEIMFIGTDVAPGESGGAVVQGSYLGDPSLNVPLDVRYEGVAGPNGTFTVVGASPLDGVTSSISTLKRALAFALPLLVALVGALAWFVTGRALRPVDAIRAQVDAITASSLDRRIPEPATGDEVSRLAHTMNAMLDRLEGASRRQRQFVSDASHELRSPVATIRTELEVGTRAGASADWPRIAAVALAEEARLAALIDDLLMLATVDEGALRSHAAEDVDIAQLVRDEAARPRRVAIEVDGPPAATAPGVRRQLARVVANLFDNAARFASTTVLASVRVEDQEVVLTVDDDGPGVPVPDRRRIFERFTRLDAGRTRNEGGAGLGLALAKAIVERHHGAISALDAPLGGARIEVRLPCAM